MLVILAWCGIAIVMAVAAVVVVAAVVAIDRIIQTARQPKAKHVDE